MKEFTTIEQIMEELESVNYGYYGFRSANEHDLEIIESGRNYLDVSHVWVDGDDTGEELSGSCAIYIDECMDNAQIKDRYKQCYSYYQMLPNSKRVILLIADKNSEWGTDENEIILGSNGCGADIIGIVRL